MNVRKGVSLALGTGLLVGAALAPGMASAQSPAAGGPIHIEVVTHGQASDPFWSIFVNGVNAAAAGHGQPRRHRQLLGAERTTFDINAMAQLITAAVGKNPQGLVVSIPDATALGPAIKSAVDAGIPVISANSGSDVYKSLGILTHVGQDEFPAGKGAGEKMAALGVKNAICINQEVGNAGPRRPLRRLRRRPRHRCQVHRRPGRPERPDRRREQDRGRPPGRPDHRRASWPSARPAPRRPSRPSTSWA